jgi:hypothetical protein
VISSLELLLYIKEGILEREKDWKRFFTKCMVEFEDELRGFEGIPLVEYNH